MPRVETLHSLAKICYQILLSDRDCNMAVGGMTGEGKSTFLSKLLQAYAKISGVKWDFNLMTWSRKELLEWIDGKKGGKVLKSGLREKQLPEFSAIDVDELWLLFYKRNWYDEGQIDSIGTLNMCRDRHLFIGGNVPKFWDLDSAFLSRIRFYAFVLQRGKAWIFEQENNPFADDTWNKNFNSKIFRRAKNLFMSPNFVCEVNFPDWTPAEKETYYAVRNEKRLMAIDQYKQDDQRERYHSIKSQRDKLIKLLFEQNADIVSHKKIAKELGVSKLTNQGIADVIGISHEACRLIRLGER